MTDPLEFFPGYVSPLTDKEHATIGRIALLWGQIEHFVDGLLPEISGLSREQLEALQVKEKPMASKVAFLKASAKRHNHGPTGQSVAEFCKLVEDTKTQRNHAFHGIWGWRGDDRTERVYPAAQKESDPQSPFEIARSDAATPVDASEAADRMVPPADAGVPDVSVVVDAAPPMCLVSSDCAAADVSFPNGPRRWDVMTRRVAARVPTRRPYVRLGVRGRQRR